MNSTQNNKGMKMMMHVIISIHTHVKTGAFLRMSVHLHFYISYIHMLTAFD